MGTYAVCGLVWLASLAVWAEQQLVQYNSSSWQFSLLHGGATGMVDPVRGYGYSKYSHCDSQIVRLQHAVAVACLRCCSITVGGGACAA